MNKEGKDRDKNEPITTAPDLPPNAGQGAERDPRAVGAGPGNQLQDNLIRPSDPEPSQSDLRPGAQPDGTATIPNRAPRNEPVEQADGSGDSSGVE